MNHFGYNTSTHQVFVICSIFILLLGLFKIVILFVNFCKSPPSMESSISLVPSIYLRQAKMTSLEQRECHKKTYVLIPIYYCYYFTSSSKLISEQKRTIEITYKNNQVAFSRVFLSPEQTFKLHLNKKTQRHQPVLDMDVTNEGLGVSCSHDGSLLIWLTSTGQIRV